MSVIKEGKITNIADYDLRKGDILLLQAGDLVPADLKLIEAKGLELDEFELTGEIMPVDKKVDGEDTFVYKGSTVTRGNGRGVVIALGEDTEYGEILKQRWGQVKYKFSFSIKGTYFILLILLIPPFVASLCRYGNPALICMLYLSLAVAVVLMQNDELFKYILASNAIRNIEAQGIKVYDETSLDPLNNVNVICFDKTGVLTTRDIEVKHVHFADETPSMDSLSDKTIFNLTKLACALCNDVIFVERIGQANPIDRALVSFAGKNGIDVSETISKNKRIYEKPFESENRYMASGFELNDERVYFAKGDPDVILKICQNYATVSGIEKRVDLEFLSTMYAKTYSISKKGDVAIALAYSLGASENPPAHYTFLCLLQLENSVKPGVPTVIRKLKEKRLRTLILTGDRPETAMKIGEETGINTDSNYCLTGKNMAQMGLSEVARQSDYVSVFARLLPSQKGVLIMLLQQRSNSVAMVGDGANDTIALRVADVGISFLENSSPLAKRVSKILINDLTDLLITIQIARRTKSWVKRLVLFRVIILVSVLLVLYASMLN